jgi:glycosyltransferase involved in cell wall biosynthesis
LKIGLLTTYLALGDDADSGIGQHYHILADALAAQGHQVHVIYATRDPEPARVALATLAPPWTYDVITSRAPAWLRGAVRRSWPSQLLLENLWLSCAAGRALTAASHRHGLSVVETHSYNAPALFFLRRRRRPPVVTRVSTTTAQMAPISLVHSRVIGWQSALERRVTRRSNALVTHTVQHRDTICALEGYDPARFAIVPHGLPDPGEPPASTGINHDQTVEFLFVGRFETRKGIDVLLAAIPEVANACPAARFTLVGSTGTGSDWSEFAARYPALAASRVRLLGKVSPAALRALYQRCSVLVAPSRYESFGLIYAEAMSHGKPVIGCDAGGIPDVVTNGVTGLLAQPGDVTSLVECMNRLGADAALREQFGHAARRDFLARFSASDMAARSVELYARIARQECSSVQ